MSKKKISLQSYILFGLLGAFLVLVGYNMRSVLFGTAFKVAAAKDGSTVNSIIFPIAGSAVHAKEITIDGRSVAINPDGSFSDETILSPGYNVIEVASLDSFGNWKTKTLHIVEQTPQAVATAAQITYQQ